MPELPEVETVRRGLNQTTRHQTITGGDVLLERTIAHPLFVNEFLDGLRGKAIARWHRRGKYLLAELEQQTEAQDGSQEDLEHPRGWDGRVGKHGYLGVHLRMTGQFLWVDQAEPLQKHTRVRLFFEQDAQGDRSNSRELRFVDQRTFGQMWWVPPGVAPETVITGLSRLGPEALSEEFSVQHFQQCLAKSHRPIKNALLDQALVAGIGNIYADEALFISGIRPQTLASTLRPSQVVRLHAAIVTVLKEAIAANGTTFSDFKTVYGINGNYGHHARVYDREGQPCRVCGSPIERLKLAGRSAHFCRKCQH